MQGLSRQPRSARQPIPTALRQRISEFRKRVVELARDRWGLPLGRDVVIENKFGAGYRLNPEVVVIDSAEIKRTPDHK